MSVSDDFQISAEIALSYYWSRIYNSLLDDPESSSWNIDDRAKPDMFWRLLSVAHPDIYIKRSGKNKIPKTYLPDAIKFLTKSDVKEVVEHLLKFFPETCDCNHKAVTYKVIVVGDESDRVEKICRDCYTKKDDKVCVTSEGKVFIYNKGVLYNAKSVEDKDGNITYVRDDTKKN